jgi:hypothetical protein
MVVTVETIPVIPAPGGTTAAAVSALSAGRIGVGT